MFLNSIDVVALALPPVCWGIYGQLRKHFSPSMDTISFTAVYVVGQLLFSLGLWLCYGLYLEPSLEAWNAATVFFGGFSVLFAEYFFLAASDRMSTSTASAFFCLSAGIGVPLDFFCDQDKNVDGLYLSLGTGLLLSGLIMLILAEYLIPEGSKSENSFLAPRSIYSSAGSVRGGYESVIDSHEPSVATKESRCEDIEGGTAGRSYAVDFHEPSVTSRPSRTGSNPPSVASRSSRGRSALGAVPDKATALLPGVCFGVLAGVCNSFWSVLSALASARAGSFTSPSTMLLVFEAGQLAALPLVLTIFGYLDLLGLQAGADRAAWAPTAWARLLGAPAQAAWALAIGGLVGLGYFGYFFSTLRRPESGGAPASVAYALSFCDMLVSLYASLFLFGDYGDWRAIQPGGACCLALLAGTAAYVAGICVLARQLD